MRPHLTLMTRRLHKRRETNNEKTRDCSRVFGVMKSLDH
jgi:hypothetical protein